MRIAAISLATVGLGVVTLVATACKDGTGTAADRPATSAAPSAAPAPSATASPSIPAPPRQGSRPQPTVTGRQIIMIDPDGKRYTRTTMIQMAAGMAAVSGRLPSDFCSRSYADGVRKGGTFPAGKAAFLEACQEGVRLAKEYEGK